jgi:metallo-beta-lactamase class B
MRYRYRLGNGYALLAVALLCASAAAHAQRTRTPPPLSEMAREPFQVFDNLYFVGTGEVASYVVKTSDGLILIDTLWGGEYTDYLLDNMNRLGLDIADVKYVLILQGHWDHYGGARKLQDEHTDAAFGAAEEDWKMIEADLGNRAPRRGFVIEEGDTLTLGDTTIRFEITPGHTPGTTSLRFPVFDNGVRHEAYFHGGSALRTDDPDAIRTFIADLERIKKIPNIDVQIINHYDIHAAGADDLFQRAARLANRKPGEPHPWVAPDEFQAWLDETIAEARGRLERAL